MHDCEDFAVCSADTHITEVKEKVLEFLSSEVKALIVLTIESPCYK